MAVRCCAVMLGCALCFLPGTIQADDSPWHTTAKRVDLLLEQAWSDAGVSPADRSSDAEFLRRVYLDLTGVIPAVSQVRQFLADQRPDKRARLIDRLLGIAGDDATDRPNNARHATHLANKWREVMIPPGGNARRFGQTRIFENWLRGHFADNTAYDELVRELLTATGQVNQSGPALYYTALELKPEEIAASTSRIFLGVQIECAQCHNHPFDRWTRQDFWGYAAFFARLQRPAGRPAGFEVSESDSGEVKLPDTDTVVLPRYLDGAAPGNANSQSRRKLLADWLTSPQNPWFARATVNRVWAILFGYGLVDPVDDFSDHNPPSHPEVLDLLAEDFVAHGYDLRRLFRILANTRAYQLTSRTESAADTDPTLFARMAVKSLTAEQIYDCLNEAIRRRETITTASGQQRIFNGTDRDRQAFLAKFEAPGQGATEYQGGIPQALTMMNGQVIADATDIGQSDLLAALIDSPFFTDSERVDVLFLSTLSRRPTDIERSRFVNHVESGGPRDDRRQALADVLWALLNSTEFILNH